MCQLEGYPWQAMLLNMSERFQTGKGSAVLRSITRTFQANNPYLCPVCTSLCR